MQNQCIPDLLLTLKWNEPPEEESEPLLNRWLWMKISQFHTYNSKKSQQLLLSNVGKFRLLKDCFNRENIILNLETYRQYMQFGWNICQNCCQTTLWIRTVSLSFIPVISVLVADIFSAQYFDQLLSRSWDCLFYRQIFVSARHFWECLVYHALDLREWLQIYPFCLQTSQLRLDVSWNCQKTETEGKFTSFTTSWTI